MALEWQGVPIVGVTFATPSGTFLLASCHGNALAFPATCFVHVIPIEEEDSHSGRLRFGSFNAPSACVFSGLTRSTTCEQTQGLAWTCRMLVP